MQVARQRLLVDVRERLGQGAKDAHRIARQAQQSAREHPQLTRVAVVGEAHLGRHLATLRAQVEQGTHDLGTRHPVDDRVVDLRHHGLVPALEAVDQVELPQRAGAVERARHDPRHLLGQLRVAAGRRQRQLADVVLEIEVRIVDPVRVVERERHFLQPPAEGWQQRQPLGDHVVDVGELEAAVGARARIEHSHAADVSSLAR